MVARTLLEEFDRLERDEQIALVQHLWDRIAPRGDEVVLTEGQRAELDRRIAAHDADPDRTLSWEQVKAQILDRLRSQ